MNKILQVTIFDLEGHCPMELIETAWFSSVSAALDFAEPSLRCTSLCVKFAWVDSFFTEGVVL